MNELTRSPVADYFRPNFWPNTPDILTDELQRGGRAGFLSRFVLAATLSSPTTASTVRPSSSKSTFLEPLVRRSTYCQKNTSCARGTFAVPAACRRSSVS
jgi:hypothetical protein